MATNPASNLSTPAAEWLAEQFEFEFCAECGGDAEHHTAVPFLGNWFARCNCDPGPNGEPHPTIARFRADNGYEPIAAA